MAARDSGIQPDHSTRRAGGRAAAILSLFSVVYFADTCLRASAKYFWFDEIVTALICRLPGWGAVYRATLQGADYNPPLFHFLTRLSELLFGDGLIAVRLPAIAGVWLLCVCLFFIVRRRAAPAAGAVAMLLPLFTSVRFYSYEARATGIVLGMAALAALSWQRAPASRRRKLWLALFGLSLLAAFLTHCYAITLLFPFACAEAARVIEKRRFDRWPWMLMGCAAAIALLFYIPLFRAFRQNVGAEFYPPAWGSLQAFYAMLLSPAALALAVCLAGFAAGWALTRRGAPAIPWSELVLALAFLALPATGLILSLAIHGPFIGRYWYPAVLGVCLAAGYLARGSVRWVAPAVAILLAGLLAIDSARLVRHRIRGEGEILLEPNTLLPMNTTPGHPLAAYQPLLDHISGNEPVVVADGLEFGFLNYYAPPEIRNRLYYLAGDRSDTMGGLLRNLQICCGVTYRLPSAADFGRAPPRYLVYGRTGAPLAGLLESASPGAHLEYRAFLGDRVLIEVTPR